MKQLSSIMILVLMCCIQIKAQKLIIEDEDGNLLLGVQSYLNSEFHELSDNKGEISFENLQTGDEIRLSYLGYRDYNFSVKKKISPFYEIKMELDNFLLDEIILVGRNNERPIDLPYQMRRIDEQEIRANHAQNAADILQKAGSVYVQKSQMGGGSPVVRGFEANKVLLVLDGVRLNNAIFRNGHLQNAITIDPSMLESAEVIFGPGSLNYGSDAIGGVVHYRSKTPKLSLDENSIRVSGNIFSRYASANNEKRLSSTFNLGSKKFAWLINASFVDFNDLKAGSKYDERFPDFGKRLHYVSREDGQDVILENSDPSLQIGTAYKQNDLTSKMKYQLNAHNYMQANIQYSNSSDIPRYDQLIDQNDNIFRFSEWYYGPQERLLISPSYHFNGQSKLFDELIAIAAYQKISEERNSRRFQKEFLETQLENLDVYSVSLDLKKKLFQNQRLNYGFEWQHNDVNSEAMGSSVNDPSSIVDILSRYPSAGSTLSTGGVYLHQMLNFKNMNLKWHHGVRLSHQNSDFRYLPDDPFEWPDFYFEGFENSNTAVNWMNAFALSFGNNSTLRWSVASAFRAPNIDDLAKTRVKSDEISIPNPNLIAEKTINTDLSLIVDKKDFKLDITGYFTRLNDAIVRSGGLLPDGSNYYIIDGDSLSVTQNINAERAEVFGFSAFAEFRPSNIFTLGGQINYTKGKRFDENDVSSPLVHIPPVFGKSYFKFNQDKWTAQVQYHFNGKKDISDFGGSADNPELATPVGSLGWHVINCYLNYNPTKKLNLGLAVENLFDKHYRGFSSGVSAPGRNLILSVNYSFE